MVRILKLNFILKYLFVTFFVENLMLIVDKYFAVQPVCKFLHFYYNYCDFMRFNY